MSAVISRAAGPGLHDGAPPAPAPLGALLEARCHGTFVAAGVAYPSPGFILRTVVPACSDQVAEAPDGFRQCGNETAPETRPDGEHEDAGAAGDGAAADPFARALAAARADGFAAGLDEGRAQAETQAAIALAELGALAAALSVARAFDPAELAAELARTTLALLTALLDEEPSLAAHGLATRAGRALATLAGRTGPAVLWLAPADAAALAPGLARAGLDIVPDPTLVRGALRLTTRESRLDDSPAERLARLAPLLDERATALSQSHPGVAPEDAGLPACKAGMPGTRRT